MSDRPESMSSSLGDFTRAAEFVAKYGAAVTFAALGTAFLYDAVYFWMIDGRMLEYFTVADHIQTAVKMVAAMILVGSWTLLVWLVFMKIGVWLESKRQAKPRVFHRWLILFLVIALPYSVWRIIESSAWRLKPIEDWPNILDGILMIFLLIIGAWQLLISTKDGFATISNWQDSATVKYVLKRPLQSFAVAWIAGAIYVAGTDGYLAGHGYRIGGLPTKVRDIIWLENDSTIAGNVLRVLDKGLLVRDPVDGFVTFVPKERIRRLDRNRPIP